LALHGTVVDSTGAAVVGARVSASADEGAPGLATVSDHNGTFTLLLDPGRYTVTVGATGFQEVAQHLAVASPGSDSREFVLQVAGVHEIVTVNAPAGYQGPATTSATKTLTPLRDVPHSITVVTRQLMQDELMTSIGDVVRYVPGIAAHQGENNRDQIIIRGNSSSADFFLNGVRDDVQYYRDLYNLDRVEALKGANAMVFGRGGGGGVINRVTKEAGFSALQEVALQAGAYDNKRITADVDQPLSEAVAFRINGVYEHSGSFRQAVGLERSGIAPTLTFMANQTKITLGYEYLHDTRVADRGISSYQGKPVDVPIDTYYGNPSDSRVRASVNLASALVEHHVGQLTIRNRTLVGHYDRGYQNYVPGAVTTDRSQVALTAYNNATERLNVFNQTDLIYVVSAGRVRHTLLAGAELGRQLTDNFRNTGFFNNTATSLLVPYHATTITTPVTFRQSATDADNHLRTNVAATYAQDQIALTLHVQIIAGLRFDRFDLQYHNNRNGDTLSRTDNLISPRAGLVVKPITALSLYGTYSVSYLPSSGDQFSSLTTITQQVEPEQFTNYEVGVKWDAHRDLSLTTAVYRLDRANTRATDPNDPTRIMQTGSQRTNGYELGANGHIAGAWNIAGGYAWQDAVVTSATAAAAAGAHTAQVPRHTVSFWNRVQFAPKLSAGLGIIHQTEMYATIDNTVTLPRFTRVDAAAYYALAKGLRLQVNVENLFDRTYYTNADSNTNISPGFPRAVRIGVTTRF
jgi:catecholate siderophore receptor